jgi:hypothetical protein
MADLLMEFADSDPSARKRLVLAAAESEGPAALAKALDRRLAALASSRGFIDWEKARDYARDLDGLRRGLASLAPADPAGAADRLERLLRLAPSVFQRVDDSSGRIGGVFQAATADLAAAWSRIPGADPAQLARQAFDLITADDHSVCEGLVEAASPALGNAGLSALADLARQALASPAAGKSGAIDWRAYTLRRTLGEIADLQGDVDAFIEAQTDGGRPSIPAIAVRLIEAGRPAEALEWLDRKAGRPEVRVFTPADLIAARDGSPAALGVEWERDTLRIRALEGLQRRPEAQQIRWRLFEQTLDVDILRGYLKALPDFEDDEALERAHALVRAHPSAAMALRFLVEWPDLKRAEALITTRLAEFDGRDYEILEAAADALAEPAPHAASLLLRCMIDSVLERGSSSAYGHIARCLTVCEALAARVDWRAAGAPSHPDYVDGLRRRHGRKSSFWSQVGTG